MGQPAPAPTVDRDALLRRFRDGDVRVGVLGLGYVGLPLALTFAEAGVRVIGFEVDPAKVQQLSKGQSYLTTTSPGRVASVMATGRLEVTTDYARSAQCDALISCVPTPLGPAREPDMSFIVATCEQVLPHLRPGQIMLLESSTYPGTTEEVCGGILSRSGLRLGEDYWLAYSPEREDPGNGEFSTSTIPKLVGGLDKYSGDLAEALYRRAIRHVIRVSHARVAEAAKLTENIYRSVNIALVNELKVVFEALGIDVWEVIEAASSKPFGYQPFWPGPGLGGHCIPIDPFYLTWKAATVGIPTRFIELAGEINSAMPQRVVHRVQDALNDRGLALRGAKILLLGVAYKPGVSDTRESPGLELIHLLEEKGAVISFHDPLVPVLGPTRRFPVTRRGAPLTPETVRGADLVLLVTAQPGMDLGMVAREAMVIVDTRNAFAPFPGAPVVKA